MKSDGRAGEGMMVDMTGLDAQSDLCEAINQ